jgi:hypothetical protein
MQKMIRSRIKLFYKNMAENIAMQQFVASSRRFQAQCASGQGNRPTGDKATPLRLTLQAAWAPFPGASDLFQ